MSGPSTKKRPPRERAFVPHPDDEADVRAGRAETEGREGVRLTDEQVLRWAETGELPCLESSPSRRGS